MSVTYEGKMWYLALLKSIPGRIGCAVRRRYLRAEVHPTAMIWDGVHIDYPSRLVVGARTSINRGTIINAAGRVTVGADVLVGPDVLIYSQNHVYSAPDVLISAQGYELAPVVIEDGAWLAARAVVLPGVRIGAGAVVAAGAVVTKDVASKSVVAGVPARQIGVRDGGAGRQR